MKEMKEIFVRPERCMACHNCELACAVQHAAAGSLDQAIGEEPAPRRRIFVEWIAPAKSVPVLCRHCEEAPCLHACISGAISRTPEGVVRTDESRCIGCWTCVMVCPYGVIGRHPTTGTAYRCDRCPGRDVPACVAACPTKALVYQSAADWAGARRRKAAGELVADQDG
ncbi:MAG: 4Fe-4S dicluster domain-containing protein [Thermodesulfobacteriota bacterium]